MTMPYIKFSLGAICILLFSACSQPVSEQMFCTQEYAPVCGQVGDIRMTFSNRCRAELEKAIDISEGACNSSTSQESSSCDDEYAPVCARVSVQCIQAPCDPIEQTFANVCEAETVGAEIAYQGECLLSSDIPAENALRASIDSFKPLTADTVLFIEKEQDGYILVRLTQDSVISHVIVKQTGDTMKVVDTCAKVPVFFLEYCQE